ncbi:hypothetical protein HK098_000209 [Nowakowskiella sp. JEL0407]|nr:hypothetical protein HK098_000209 [Nowakowskiella sp. JEL0407]
MFLLKSTHPISTSTLFPATSQQPSLRWFSVSKASYLRYAKIKPASPKLQIVRKLRVIPTTNTPKRPSTSYGLFLKDEFSKLYEASKELPPQTIMKLLASKWNGSPNSIKKKYESEAAHERLKYEKDYAKFMQNVKPKQVLFSIKRRNLLKKLHPNKPLSKALTDPNAPPKPLTSYLHFVKDAREASDVVQTQILGKPLAKMSFEESGRALGAAWKRIPSDMKKLYENQALASRAKYYTAIKAYKVRVGADELERELRGKLRLAAIGRRDTLKGRKRVAKKSATRKSSKPKKQKLLKKSTKKPMEKSAKRVVKKDSRKLAQ